MKVDVENVTVSLKGRVVVHNVSASFASGSVVGIVGPNGSGKSTLLRTLYRAVTPTSGRVRLDGTDVRSVSARRAARMVSVMLQDPPSDFDLSVEETVMLGRAPHHATFGRDSVADQRIVAEVMARTNIVEMADRMLATLSGGQRQRVMLARALAQQTPVMVLDEPSNHLDISHQHELMGTVSSLGCTVVAALHDLNLAAQYCDSVVVLADGRVVAHGPPADVLSPNLIRSTFGVDTRIFGDAKEPVYAFRRLGAQLSNEEKAELHEYFLPRIAPARRATVAVVCSATLLLLGCGSGVTADVEQGGDTDATTVENCARELTVDRAPTAAVGMHPAQTELMIRLGLADRLAGQAQATVQALPKDVASQAEEIPVLGDVAPPSREDLLAVEPDFVYSPTTYEFSSERGFASIEQLNEANAAVYVATGGCAERRMSGEVADLFTDLENLGEIFDVQAEAADLIARNQAVLSDVAAATAQVEPLRVAQVYYDGGVLQAIGAGIEYDILKRAGATNIYTPAQPAFADFFAATITPESLGATEPDAIVFAAYDEDHENATRAYLTRTFPDMPAVRNDRLIAVSTSQMFPGTLGNISAVQQIAKQLYPDAF